MKNKNKTHLILIIITLLFLFAFSIQFSSATPIVNIDNTTSGGGILKGIGDVDPNGVIILDIGDYSGSNNTGLNISKNMTMQGTNTNKIVINGENSNQGITITGTNNIITIKNLKFQNFNSTNRGGAAIYNPTSSNKLIIVNCTFINCNALGQPYYGGAIYSLGYIELINCTFINNSAHSGGAVSSGGNAGMYVDNCEFYNNKGVNQTTLSTGGAIQTRYNCIIKNSYFENNFAYYAGAIGNRWTNAENNTIINCTFINNSGEAAAAIDLCGNNHLITNCIFEGNYAPGRIIFFGVGGGKGYSNVTVSNCIFNENTASRGQTDSGIIVSSGVDNVTIFNNTFINNIIQQKLPATISLINGNIAEVSNNTLISNGSRSIQTYGLNNTKILYNTIIGTDIGIFVSQADNVTVNHNRIVCKLGLQNDQGIVFGQNLSGTNLDLRYNWWGSNKPNIVGIDLTNWYIVTVTPQGDLTKGIEEFSYNMKLYGEGSDIHSILPEFNGTAHTTLSNNALYFDAKVAQNIKIVNDIEGKATYYFWIDNQYFEFEGTSWKKLQTNTTIVISDNITVKDIITITGQVTDENNAIVGNITIKVEIDGDIFTIDVDENGNWNLDYTVIRSGNFNIIASWEGNNVYHGFIQNSGFNANIEQEKDLKELNTSDVIDGNGSYVIDEDGTTDESSSIKTTKNKSSAEHDNTLTKNPLTKASMKKTGMTIMIVLLILLSSLRLITRKK